MPTYEYICANCGEATEEFQGIKEEPLKRCKSCGKNKLERQIGAGSCVIFRGTGFYETDYKKGDKSD